MNNDKIIAILYANEERIAEALKTADVADESYVRLLNHIGMGRNLASAIANQPNPFGEQTEENCDRNPEPERVTLASNVVLFPTPEERAADPENAEEASEAARVEPEPEEAPIRPTSTLTKEEVRARIGRLASQYKDLDVVSIFQEMGGYTKLGEIPPERYEELLKRVEEAI